MRHGQSLAKLFLPTGYKLTLLTTKGGSGAEAIITITGQKLGPPSRRLVFHQKKLKITHAEIKAHTKKGDQHIVVDRINHHRSFEQVRLHSKQTLYPGQYTVTMTFIVKPPANGEEPEQIQAAFKAGQPVREYFPSVDEPLAKSGVTLEIKTE
jgi:hypothetical protein